MFVKTLLVAFALVCVVQADIDYVDEVMKKIDDFRKITEKRVQEAELKMENAYSSITIGEGITNMINEVAVEAKKTIDEYTQKANDADVDATECFKDTNKIESLLVQLREKTAKCVNDAVQYNYKEKMAKALEQLRLHLSKVGTFARNAHEALEGCDLDTKCRVEVASKFYQELDPIKKEGEQVYREVDDISYSVKFMTMYCTGVAINESEIGKIIEFAMNCVDCKVDAQKCKPNSFNRNVLLMKLIKL